MSRAEICAMYLVSGQPHIYLAGDKSPGWGSLCENYGRIRSELEELNPDLILYFSTQWLSVLGWLFQSNPEPEFVHVDHNWHDLGTIPYKFLVDPDFAPVHAAEVKKTGRHTMLVNYEGFPIDTGTIVAQKLINPDNRFPATMISCNMYAEKEETMEIGRATRRAIDAYGKKVAIVLVSNLSNRYFTGEIEPSQDHISSKKDDEWNLKILELMGEGRLEDVAQCARDFAREANGDMQFKGIWWLNALAGETNDFEGKIFDYQPVWGTGAALVGLYPKGSLPAVSGSSTKEEIGTVESGSSNAQQTVTGKESLVVQSQTAASPVGPYPHARQEGDLVFLSGIGPRERVTDHIPGLKLDDQGNCLEYDIEAETHSVFRNVIAVLESAGCRLENVVDVQVFLTNMKDDFKTFNRIYGEYFDGQSGPTRTTIGITALPTPIHVELKVIARKG